MNAGASAGMQLLSADELRRGLEALENKLAERNVFGCLYVVGGAVMAMAFQPERMTRDIDAVIVKNHDPVLECAKEVAKDFGWNPQWLNDRVAQLVRIIPRDISDDADAVTLWDGRHLMVTGASPKYLLAMKIRANREEDQGDIRALIDMLGLETSEQVFDVHDQVFPNWPLAEVEVFNIRNSLDRLFRGRRESLGVDLPR